MLNSLVNTPLFNGVKQANQQLKASLETSLKAYLANESQLLVSQEKFASLHQHLHQLNQELNQAETRLNQVQQALELRRNN